MSQLIKANQLNQIRDQLDFVHADCFDQFVTAVINWYQREVTHPTLYLDMVDRVQLVPNVFCVFEYPANNSEIITRLFFDSIVRYKMDQHQSGYKEVEDEAVEVFNDTLLERHPLMIKDIQRVLDAYHLFHCYNEDGFTPYFYFNQSLREVW